MHSSRLLSSHHFHSCQSALIHSPYFLISTFCPFGFSLLVPSFAASVSIFACLPLKHLACLQNFTVSLASHISTTASLYANRPHSCERCVSPNRSLFGLSCSPTSALYPQRSLAHLRSFALSNQCCWIPAAPPSMHVLQNFTPDEIDEMSRKPGV